MSDCEPVERPILFSAPMVQAILCGDKSVTRRVVIPQPPEWVSDIVTGSYHPVIIYRGEEEPGPETFGAYDTQTGEWTARCPYGAPGDRLWVRETHAVLWQGSYEPVREPNEWDAQRHHYHVDYAADEKHLTTTETRGYRWRPSIHMPRWASRISLEVVAVWVERLQELTEEEAFDEGVERPPEPYPILGWAGGTRMEETAQGHWRSKYACWHREQFRALWDRINAGRGYSWETNPWVWVVSFRRVLDGVEAPVRTT